MELVERNGLLDQADFVVLCVPLTDETRGMIDRSALGSMKADAHLVNVARGPVVVTEDLLEVMRGGRLLAQGTPAELSKSGDPYVGELLRTPRRQAERLGTLLPRDGAA